MKLGLLSAAAAVALLAVSSSASAAQFIVNNVSYPYLTTANVSGNIADPAAPGGSYAYSGTVYDGPIFLTGQLNGTGPDETIFALCVDLFHNIYSGPQTITYNIGSITNNSSDNMGGAKLSSATVDTISGLARYAYDLYESGDPNWLDKDYAIQGVIWADEYSTPGNPFSVSFGDPTIEGYYNTFSGWTFPPPALLGLHSTDAQGLIDVQSLVPGNLSVPEPAAWMMLILGVAIIGAAARRRNSGLVLAS